MLCDAETQTLIQSQNPKYQIIMYFSIGTGASRNVLYPHPFKVSVNNSAIPSKSYLGPAKKPWASQPVNLTPYLSLKLQNKLSIEFFSGRKVYLSNQGAFTPGPSGAN